MRRPSILQTATAWVTGGLATAGLTPPGMVIASVTRSSTLVFRMARLWGRICVWGTGCPVETRGLGRIDPAARYVIMANHQSALDIPLLMAVLPAEWRTVFWAKKSLFKIPILGAAMRGLGHMPVDRENRLQAPQMLSDSLHRLEDTRSLVVFPEETYGPGERLLPFRRGGFLLALKTGMPILPVGVRGARDALPPSGRLISRTKIEVRFGVPIATAAMSISDRIELIERTRTAIEELSGLVD